MNIKAQDVLKLGDKTVTVSTRDVVTPLSEVLLEIAREHDPQQLRTTPGSIRAAQHLKVALAREGWTFERLF